MSKIMTSKRVAVALFLYISLGISHQSRAQEAVSMQPHIEKPVSIVASFSILADIVKEIGGDFVSVASLVPPNTDLHHFAMTFQDVLRINTASLFIMNGLELEKSIESFFAAIDHDHVKTVIATESIDKLRTRCHGDPRKEKKTNTHGHPEQANPHESRRDPHAWLDPRNIQVYVNNIRKALCEVDPQHCADYTLNAARYKVRIQSLHDGIVALLQDFPRDKPRLAITHDTLDPFTCAYGIRFATMKHRHPEDIPSAQEMKDFILRIKQENLRAIFLIDHEMPALAKTLSTETKIPIQGRLYIDTVPESGESPAPTYIDIMEHNARQISLAAHTNRPRATPSTPEERP